MMYVFCAVFQYWFTTHRGTSLFLCASFVLVNIFMFYTILLTHFHFYLLYLLWNSCNGNDATPALEALRHWHMGKHITKRHWRCCWSMEEAVTCMCEGKKTSASVKHHIEHLLNKKRLFSEPPTVHGVSWHFSRIYSKANQVIKSEGIRKVEYAYHFWKCTEAVFQKLSKLVHACRNYSLPKLSWFFSHSVSVFRTE